MKQIKEFIIEKFKINSKMLKDNFYEFDKENFPDGLSIQLPFKLIIADAKTYEEVYNINKVEKTGTNNRKILYWQLLDKDYNTITTLSKISISSLIENKKRIFAVIIKLHGENYGKSDTIYIHKNDL